MNLNDKDIKTIKDMMEELRMYRNEDEEPREMDEDGLYEDEIALATKLGITLE